MKAILIFLLTQFTLFCGVSQNSFIWELNADFQDQSGLFGVPNLQFEPGNDEISIVFPTTIGYSLFISNKDKTYQKIYNVGWDSLSFMNRSVEYDRKGDYHLISSNFTYLTQNNSSICLLNPKLNKNWCKNVGKNRTTSNNKISKDNYIYSTIDHASNNGLIPNIPIVKYDINGNLQWRYAFGLDTIVDHNLLRSGKFIETKSGDIALNIQLLKTFSIGLFGLLKISSEGEILNNLVLTMPNTSKNDTLQLYGSGIVEDGDGNFFVPLKINNASNPAIQNETEAVVLKIDSNFDFVWAKRLSSENFENRRLVLSVSKNGQLIFVMSSNENLPVIAGKLDVQGNLLWNRGYEFFFPDVEIASDSSLYILSYRKYYDDGTFDRAKIIAKTNPDGTIDGCPQFESCVEVSDVEVLFDKWKWKRDTTTSFGDFEITIDTLPFTLTDHCGSPRPPTPYFTFPDTICQNQCLRPDSLYNHLAHAVEWTITGDDVLFENQDTSFNYCFDTPGKYQIEQEVWLLGCSDFFTREVVVLPDSLGDLLGDDQLICDDTFAVLKPNAIRPIRDYLWSDSSRNLSLTISQSGIYGVEVSDGFCTASDEIEISFFDDLFSGVDLELPNDTSICQELLPFTLTPKSDFSNEFFLNGSTNPQSNFEIETIGNYQISAKIEGCEITKDFNLSLIPCEVDIYIPSSFSPNNDGINDLLEPLGNDFIGKQMQVFDRWGGLLFETKEAPFAWDGGKAEEGVYVMTFSYLNLKNQQEEMVSGDVLVLR